MRKHQAVGSTPTFWLMFKGTPLDMRNQGWHTRHMEQLKRRKRIRQLHIEANRNFVSTQREMHKDLQSKADESALKQKKDWNWFQWLIMAIWFRLTNPFRKLYGYVKT